MARASHEVTAEHAKAILHNTPNGVLLVDGDTVVRFVNPAFCSMFSCTEKNTLNQPAEKHLHSDCFKKAITAGGELTVKETVADLNVSFRAGIFPIEGHNLYCGIFIDTSGEEEAKKHYRDLKAETLQKAQEVISRQMQTAQEIARLLGETTAETKVLLVKLMSLFEEESEE